MVTTSTKRATPMAASDRRAMIIDAVIPLLLKHGNALTSRQIAETIGIAEGTIFRVFDDKDSLIQAAIDKYFDPEPLRADLRHIDPELPVEQKLGIIVRLLRERFAGIFALASVFSDGRRRWNPPERNVFVEIVVGILESDRERLNFPAERIAHLARLLAFASAFPHFNDGVEFENDELTRVLLYGVIGTIPGDIPADNH